MIVLLVMYRPLLMQGMQCPDIVIVILMLYVFETHGWLVVGLSPIATRET